MTKEKTTLILGAGASKPYEFPLGSELRQMIINLASDHVEIAKLMSIEPDHLAKFIASFRASHNVSIDSFLARRTEYAGVGKMAIAFILLRCEQTARFDLADNWYEYLVNVIDRASGSEPELGWLSIVTFNYDRSLEEFLITCLAEMFGKDREAMTDIVASTDLVHMYGSLGSPWPKDKNFVKYGTFDEKNRKAAVHDAAAEIKIIGESRDSEETMARARELISAADRVCFLGFGFDEFNVRRLGGPTTFSPRDGKVKRVVATGLGMREAEIRDASQLVLGNIDPNCFHDCQCLELLRRTGVLK